MFKKLFGILVFGLLIATALPAVGTMNEKVSSINNSPVTFQPLVGGLDQQQTKQDGMGFYILPSQWLAQGFKPSVEKLAAVQLYIFKHDNPPEGIEITVSIRESLNGIDLAVANENADQIEDYKWVTFNFPEINVTPEQQYYIICRSDGGSGMDVYCWFYGNDNPYDRGDAWMSADEGNIWSKFETDPNYNYPDLCFKTYSKKTNDLVSEPGQASTGIAWSENFDSYTLGQLLDGTPDDGGWKLCDCPYQSDGAYVVDDQFLSTPHSVEIVGYTDIIHEFTRIRSGNWTLTNWVYVPTEFSDKAAFALDSYRPTPWDNWLLCRQQALYLNGNTGLVEDYSSGLTLPLITDQWIELRFEIDFEADWLECYYNDELLAEKVWTDDIIPGYTGFRNLAALTLCYGSGVAMDTPIYHDDFSLDGEETGLIPDIQCDGSISLTCKKDETVTGTFTLQNIGDPSSRLEWIIDEYPDFGTWTIEPPRGSLTPEDGEQSVTVTIVAPSKTGEYSGVINVIAVGDPDDYCEIPILLDVPRNRAVNFNILDWYFEHYPNAFPILRQLLGLL